MLLDLPDHDSTEVSHHLEVDRLVELADLLVWVLDPQKYADAAIHDRYLAPLASHAGVMLVVLNHIDTVPEERRQAMVDDVRRLLDHDGLAEVPVHRDQRPRTATASTSCAPRSPAGSRTRRSTRQRLEADLRAAAARLDEDVRHAASRARWPPARVAALEDALRRRRRRADRGRGRRAVDPAAGQPGHRLAGRRRGSRGSGPTRSSGCTSTSAPTGKQLTGRGRARRCPRPTPVQRARVDTEVRALADDVSAGLRQPWADAVRRASISRLDELGDRLDAALAETDLGVARLPVWAGLVRVLQWLLILAALGGGGWPSRWPRPGSLGADSVPQYGGFALPILLLSAGSALGSCSRWSAGCWSASTARAAAAAADRRLRDGGPRGLRTSWWSRRSRPSSTAFRDGARRARPARSQLSRSPAVHSGAGLAGRSTRLRGAGAPALSVPTPRSWPTVHRTA